MPKYKPPSFAPGDCLSVPLASGDFAAGIVIAARENHCCADYGCCLVGVLDYKESVEAPAQIFEERKWLALTHNHWKNEKVIYWLAPLINRKMKKEVKVLGQTSVTEDDLQYLSQKSHGFWGNIFESIQRQRDWDQDLANK